MTTSVAETSNGGSSVAWEMAAGALLMAVPFVVFLVFHRYDPLAPESLIMLAALVLVGLALGALAHRAGRVIGAAVMALVMTFFVDTQFQALIQETGGMYAWAARLAAAFALLFVLAWALRRHLAKILAAALVTTGITTVLFPGQTALPAQAPAPSSAPPGGQGPLFVHILLDEHIGIEGLPASIEGGRELKAFLKEFFLSHGFRLFGKAYTNFSATEMTVANMLNFRNRPERNLLEQTVGGGVFQRGAGGVTWRPRENATFRRLTEQGYRLHVLQVDNTVLCDGSGGLAECRTYPCCALKEVEDIGLASPGRLRVMASYFLEPLVSYRAVRRAYRWFAHRGVPLPAWEWEREKVAALAGARTLDDLAVSLARARRGDAYFAHVLLPHFPYVFDGACRVRPSVEWRNRWSDAGQELDRWTSGALGQKNTPASRAERYRLYFDQVRCTMAKLDRVFAAIRSAGLWQDAAIVVHGDHGSRITLRDPEGTQPPARADMIDSYSALFAVRAPAIEPGYDTRLAAVANLYAGFLRSTFTNVDPSSPVDGAPPETLFPQVAGQDRTMFDFGDGSAFVP